MKKFELMTEGIVNRFGRELYRIRSLIEFRTVSGKKVNVGDLGGLIENEENLSQSGSAWVGDNAEVFCGARIFGNAEVFENADVFGKTLIYGNAKIRDSSSVFGQARVWGNAEIYGTAEVWSEAQIGGMLTSSQKNTFLLLPQLGQAQTS